MGVDDCLVGDNHRFLCGDISINSSIHSFLVVKYAKADKVAVSVGFYYMSNALGRLLGTLGSGFIYAYAGGDSTNIPGYYPGSDGRLGLAACFLAGTLSSLLAAIITIFINDHDSGLKCRNWTIAAPKGKEDEPIEEVDIELTNGATARSTVTRSAVSA